MWNIGTLKIVNVTVEANHAETVAGGMYVAENSVLTMRRTRFIGNSAYLAQGSISILSSTSIKIGDSHFEGNRAKLRLAAALRIDATLKVSNTRSTSLRIEPCPRMIRRFDVHQGLRFHQQGRSQWWSALYQTVRDCPHRVLQLQHQ